MTEQREVQTFGDWGKIAIAKHFDKILKHEPKVLKDKDPEELHQMRVGMRRLRSAMAGFAPAVNLPKAASEKQVGKVGRILGNLRDIDVLQETLATQYEPNLPKKEHKKLTEILQFLKKQRKKAFKEVENILNDDCYINLKYSLRDWLEKPNYQTIAALKIETVLPDLLLPEASRFLLHPGWFVGIKITEGEIELREESNPETVAQILAQEEKALHELRKEAKRSRYNMSLFTDFYGEAYQNYLKQIKEIQEVLGQIQDSFVLIEFLESALESDIENEMPTFAKQIHKNRYIKWQEWQKLQQDFLTLQKRQDFRTVLQHPQNI
jgi:CHAD domain-containing protein